MPFVPDSQPAAAPKKSRFVPDEKAAEKPKEQQPDFWGNVRRGLGLTGRAAVQGMTDLASLPGDVAVMLYNMGNKEPYEVTLDDGSKAMRGGPLPLPSQNRDQLLTNAGFPEPANEGERISSAASRGMMGAGGITQLARNLSGPVAQALSQRPTMQLVSGGTGGASSQTAAELGGGPIAQIAAGLAGGGLPAAMTPRTPVLTPTTAAAAEANAAARVTGGQGAIRNSVQGGAEARATGGGSTFGTVGPDESAGLNSTQQRVAERGRALGMRLTPGQATGSRSLQQLEAKLESQPMTSGPFNTLKSGNATILNRSAAQAIGETSDVVDDVVLGRAAERMGQVFDNVGDDVARNIEPGNFLEFYRGLQGDMRGLVRGLDSEPLIEDLVSHASNGAATGEQLASLSSKLGKAAYKNMSTPSGDRDMGQALYRVKDYVDELLMQGLSPERARAFGEARQQYRNLMLLTQRVGVVNPARGDVNGRTLANTLQSKDRRGYLYGENQTPMYDAARFSQGFAPLVGDSGTATRMPLQGPIDLLTRAGGSLASQIYLSNPSVELALRAQAASRGAQQMGRALMSPPGAGDIPAAGVAGTAPASSAEERRRRALANALARSKGNN